MTTGNIQTGKRQLLTIVLFTGIGVILTGALSLCFRPYTEHGYQYQDVQKKQEEFRYLEDQKDVVFLGDSIAWAAYSPEYFWQETGIPSYSLATSGQWIGDGDLILESYLDHQTPRIAVLDANSLYTRLSRAKYMLSQVLPVFHYHFAYMAPMGPEVKDPRRGFNSSEVISPYTGNPAYMNAEIPLQPMSSMAEEKLNQMDDVCRRKGITLVLSCAPNPSAWNRGRHDAVQAWCDSHQVEFVDYNLSDIGIDWQTDTRDGGEHLNDSGAHKVCSHLSRHLFETYGMTDHRHDEKYQEWNKEYGGGN